MSNSFLRSSKVLCGTYKNKYITDLKKEIDVNTKNGQFQKTIIYIMNPDTETIDKEQYHVWWGLIFNLTGPLANGEFLVKFEFSNEYPKKPPRFKMFTPNGVYEILVYPCISNGHMHAEDYDPSLGITGFGLQLAATMANCENKDFKISNGLNVINEHVKIHEKIKLAADSHRYNLNNNIELLKRFNEHINEYKIPFKFSFLEIFDIPKSVSSSQIDSSFSQLDISSDQTADDKK
jgi:ubiquitin-protein ligase